MTTNKGPTDYEIIAELAGKAMAALIVIDPKQEWSMDEIAQMAVDQGMLVYLELKRRKDERKKTNGFDGTADSGRTTPMPRSGSGGDYQRVRGRMEK